MPQIIKNDYIAVGFDRIFPELERVIPSDGSIRVSFAKSDDIYDLSKFKGAIILGGSFESFGSVTEYEEFTACPYQVKSVIFDNDLILEKRKQISNLQKGSGWVCFLIPRIVKSIRSISKYNDLLKYSDLVKRILTENQINYFDIEGTPDIKVIHSEFDEYIRKYGIARTGFGHGSKIGFRSVAKTNINESPYHVGIEKDANLFFLPFLTKNEGLDNLTDIVRIVVESINNYRKDMKFVIPDWVEDVQFAEEKILSSEISNLEDNLAVNKKRAILLNSYKSILSTKSDPLKEKIAEILEDYFGQNVEMIEDYKDDIKILDELKNIVGIIEVKGTNRGISNEHINQTDTHRERLELPQSTPTLLIINNAMNKVGISEKQNAEVGEEQIAHAFRNKVLIIRSIDLLNLMILWENLSVKDRCEKLNDSFLNKYGWLRVDSKKAEIVEPESN